MRAAQADQRMRCHEVCLECLDKPDWEARGFAVRRQGAGSVWTQIIEERREEVSEDCLASSVAACDFCQIVGNSDTVRVVYDTVDVLAFFPLSPATQGHTLIIPKAHYRD